MKRKEPVVDVIQCLDDLLEFKVLERIRDGAEKKSDVFVVELRRASVQAKRGARPRQRGGQGDVVRCVLKTVRNPPKISNAIIKNAKPGYFVSV